MHKEKLSYRLLLETSKKMQMPFADLLGGVVLEDIIARIAGSANKENFWLRNSNVIGKEQYQKNLVLHLEYDYVIGKLKKADPEKNEQTLLMDLARQLETIFADTGIRCQLPDEKAGAKAGSSDTVKCRDRRNADSGFLKDTSDV